MKGKPSTVSTGLVLLVCLALLCPLVLRKRTIPLLAGGKTVAVAKRRLSGDVDVYVGPSKLFRLDCSFCWFEFPVLVLPLDDGKRFLCIYDNDTSYPVFVIDTGTSSTNAAIREFWVPYVVKDTAAMVRFPTQVELDGAAARLTGMTPKQFRAALIPCLDIGIYRGYWPKEAVLPLLWATQHTRWNWCNWRKIGTQQVCCIIQGDTYEGRLDGSNRRIVFVVFWKESGVDMAPYTEDGRGRLMTIHGHVVHPSFTQRAVYALQQDYSLRRLGFSEAEQQTVFKVLMEQNEIEADSFWTEKVLAKVESVQPQQPGSGR
jgi:hypothetical protein